MKYLLACVIAFSSFFCNVEGLNDDLAKFYENEIGELISYRYRVEREYEILGYKMLAIYEPSPNYETTGIIFIDSPLVFLFEKGAPPELKDWMNSRAKNRISLCIDNLNIDEESKWVLFGLKEKKEDPAFEVKMKALEADEELGDFLRSEFKNMAASEERVENFYDVHGHRIQVIYEPNYTSGVSGLYFKRVKMLIRFLDPTHKRIMDWVSDKAKPIRHSYGDFGTDARAMKIMWGIDSSNS